MGIYDSAKKPVIKDVPKKSDTELTTEAVKPTRNKKVSKNVHLNANTEE